VTVGSSSRVPGLRHAARARRQRGHDPGARAAAIDSAASHSQKPPDGSIAHSATTAVIRSLGQFPISQEPEARNQRTREGGRDAVVMWT
jgi:hypothetical protein